MVDLLPVLQNNLQDLESSWTPLHRALYHGNLRFAKLLIDHSDSNLISIKDHEDEADYIRELHSNTIEPDPSSI
ncbi:hypothetical protein MJO29_012393 [Puccinia striiformis f. sp. tritici]|uniref:Uncharacterized protein n=1 Tax=Puccinia striiformis f. sp. tritici PST-78 TaxID=1165861 RepID=A0A0L0VKP0_9BASI|nr:hypothetical protein Pst134EA_023068 [Puccinia striiformis f. sp. tritici]KAH9455608.1 hypothetical protein Pst134EA_023068 [Puccinia striiformis f. sp. tritici]KAI7946005.1 hypothetical protein MJO29_012393 [Puccinia striiformis f. sp. tritici]KAI9606196.1 hypothetical protein H4Q26_004571 [Puccinia striiformis f. sp. tritici PST-130]KNE99554.1 hypothetical protein PSTG_07268 [Puccinia striiformis f. sp. tritici PST-78]